jgi:hypothetical protein
VIALFRRSKEVIKTVDISIDRFYFAHRRSYIALSNFERLGSRLASSRALNLKLDSLTGWAGLLLRNNWAWRHKPTISM